MSYKIEQDKIEHDGFKTIYVNKQKFYVKKDVLTGKQILEIAGFDADKYDLFLVQGQHSEKIKEDQPYEIKNDLQFNALLKSVAYG